MRQVKNGRPAEGREGTGMRTSLIDDVSPPVVLVTSPTYCLIIRADANELRERLLTSHTESGPIVVDISDIDVMTSAAADAFLCLWLLSACVEREVSLVIVTPSEAVIEEVDNAL